MLDRVRPLGWVLAACCTVALVACSPPALAPEPSAGPPSASAEPDPSPEPTLPMPLDELALSPEGLGLLRFGAPAVDDADRGMIHIEPDACIDENTGMDLGVEPGDPEAALWVANDAYRSAHGPVFGVAVSAEGDVVRIDLYDDTIPTVGGVRIGDPVAAVRAAHPDAIVYEGDLSDLFVVEGDAGILQLEVARETGVFDAPYWEPEMIDTVRYINAALGFEPYNVVASDNVVGLCPF